MTELKKLAQTGCDDVTQSKSVQELEEIRVKYLGKNGVITSQMKILAILPAEEKKAFGAEVNQAKNMVTLAIETKRIELEQVELSIKLANESIDITLPIRPQKQG